MAAQETNATALIDAYLELWQRNLIAFASESAPEALVSAVRQGIEAKIDTTTGDAPPEESP